MRKRFMLFSMINMVLICTETNENLICAHTETSPRQSILILLFFHMGDLLLASFANY